MGRPRKQPETVTAPRKTCVLYARVSTKEQHEEGWSMDAQISLLRAYAAKRDLEVLGEFIEVESAKKTGRRVFADMVAKVRTEQPAAIVVEKTDRITRNMRDAVTIDELGVELHLVKEGQVISKDTRSQERFMHDIRIVLAKNYCDNLSEEARKGMREKARQGHWPTASPIGYRNVTIGGKRVIEPDPDAGPLVAQFFRSYATGEYSLKQVGFLAQSLGLKTKRSNRINLSSLHNILRNPIYAGQFVFNGQLYDGVHEPLIDRITFDKVQAVLERRNLAPAGYGSKEFAYRGIFTCGTCGCAMTAETKKGKYTYYRCTGAKGCPKTGIREELITEALGGLLDGLVIRSRCLDALRAALRTASASQAEDQRKRLEGLQKRRRGLCDRLERLYLDRVDNAVPVTVYEDLKGKWERELRDVDTALAGTDTANRTTWEDNLALLEGLSNSVSIFKSANSQRKREMVSHLLSNSTITGQKIEFKLRPWFNEVFQANLRVLHNIAKEGQIANWSG